MIAPVLPFAIVLSAIVVCLSADYPGVILRSLAALLLLAAAIAWMILHASVIFPILLVLVIIALTIGFIMNGCK